MSETRQIAPTKKENSFFILFQYLSVLRFLYSKYEGEAIRYRFYEKTFLSLKKLKNRIYCAVDKGSFK